MENFDKIKDYWEKPDTVSRLDKNLRQLEVSTVKHFLQPTDHVLNVGCGDGSETAEFGKGAKSVVASTTPIIF